MEGREEMTQTERRNGKEDEKLQEEGKIKSKEKIRKND